MSDEYYNHDGEGSGFFSLILLAVFLLGGFVVARVYEPGQAIGADAAKARLAKREKIETAASDRLAGHAVVSKEKEFVSLPIGTAVDEVAKLGSEETRAALVKRSIAKDGKYEAPKQVDVSGVDLADPALIAKGKILFMTKTCFTCHQVDPAIPAPAGLALKAPQFIGDFWGKEREVHIGYLGPIKKVVMNEEYFIESVTDPMAKVLKGALTPMILAPGLVNNEEILALMAYVKSHSK
jgi:cytochrome c551/c552